MEELGQEIEKALRQYAGTITQLIQTLRQRQQAIAQQDRHRRDDLARQHRLERDHARDLYKLTRDPGWWRRATPHQVAEVFGTARAWAEVDPVAVNAYAAMADQITQRWNIDARSLTSADLLASRLDDLDDSANSTPAADPGRPESATGAAVAVDRDSGPDATADNSSHDQAPDPSYDPAHEPPHDPELEPPYDEAPEPEDQVEFDPATGEILKAEPSEVAAVAAAVNEVVDAGYARARASELTEIPEEAREARLGSAKSFPVSLKSALAETRGATTAKKSSGTTAAKTQDRELDHGL